MACVTRCKCPKGGKTAGLVMSILALIFFEVWNLRFVIWDSIVSSIVCFTSFASAPTSFLFSAGIFGSSFIRVVKAPDLPKN